MAETDWYYFYGDGIRRPFFAEKASEDGKLPPAPPWRQFGSPEDLPPADELQERWRKLHDLASKNARDLKRGETFRLQWTRDGSELPEMSEDVREVLDAVNAAIYLRRPLLVTGIPGSGKTSLAYAIAWGLKLGPVLSWPITARSTLQDGLYRYDAIGRLQDADFPGSLRRGTPAGGEGDKPKPDGVSQARAQSEGNIGDYIELRAVGTAFLPSHLPRVLLIDEIDKSDINLPNELLNLFEEGEYPIPELVRRAERERKIRVQTADEGIRVEIDRGRVRCREFPIVVMTSNGERDFPPAFLRRCLRVKMPDPDREALKTIVRAHFQEQDNFKEGG